MKKVFPVLKHLSLPNLITSFSLVIGLIALFLILNNQVILAMTIFPIAILCDRLDGYVARKLSKSSEFGVQLDSLADSFNYCFLPGMFVYFLGFNTNIAKVIIIFYFLCGIWRLANFNLTADDDTKNKRIYLGLPTPYSASLILITISLSLVLKVNYINYIFGATVLAMSLLEISSIQILKDGLLTKMLFLLTPIAVILLWV